MLLKVQKGQHSVKINLSDDSSYSLLVEALEGQLKVSDLAVDLLVGYPPVILKALGPESLASLGVKGGSVISVRDNPKKKLIADALLELGFPVVKVREALHLVNTETDSVETALEICMQLASSEGVSVPKQPIARKIIDADNSCLFNAIGYLVNNGNCAAFTPMQYRQAVSTAILEDPVTFTEEMLEKPREEYAAWILNPEKWGGEIELFALAKYLNIEIAAIDIRTGNVLVYGEGAAKGSGSNNASGMEGNRIYVIYDGAHYDAVIREKGRMPGAQEVTKFDSQDTETLAEVQALARQLRESKQFVNLSSGALQCKVCMAVVEGEAAAVQHAKETGHQNFGQV